MIKDYQKKMGLQLVGSFVASDAAVWKCPLKNYAKWCKSICSLNIYPTDTFDQETAVSQNQDHDDN